MISPLLANIYLHYAFDLWAERWRRREATGDMIIVRYADDSHRRLRARGRRPALPRRDARAVGGVCAVASSGEDPADRVWPLTRRQTASGAGSASRRPSPSWASPSSAANRVGANSKSNGNPAATACGRSSSHQTGTATAHASADPRTGKMVEAGRHRLLQLPRGADKQFERSPPSASTSPNSGGARSGGAARRIG